jgi:plasmid replication initiation protein
MKLDKMHYPKDWVVLQNRVLDCFRGMTIDERRLFILATPLARLSEGESNVAIFYSTEEYAFHCGIDYSTAYNALNNATNKLFSREFSYINTDGDSVKMRWITKIVFSKNQHGVNIFFSDDVLTLLRNFDSLNPYTKYKKEVILRLKRDYSMDLYHLAKKQQRIGTLIITIDEMIKQFGLPSSYKDISNFKKRVLFPSVDEINEKTDIELSYESIKESRTIIGYEFKISPNSKNAVNPAPKLIGQQKDPLFKMTASQLNAFGNQLALLPELAHLAVGNESYEALASRIKDMLCDVDKREMFRPHLTKLGFTFR